MRPDQFMPSWLIGFLFCIGLSLGSLALLMMQHMSGGAVGARDAARFSRPPAGCCRSCALLFVPIALDAAEAVPRGRGPKRCARDAILQHKAAYLNLPFFLIRAVVYFCVWIGCAYFLNKWSGAQDRGELAVTEADTRRFRVVSAPGLVAYVHAR